MSIEALLQSLPEPFGEWIQGNEIALLVISSFVVGYVIGRFRGFRGFRAFRAFRDSRYQNRGEARLTRALRKNFGFSDYHLMNHVTLQLDDGTTQVDHILVSRFGVFVIETKDYKGWIFADAAQAKWTQVLFNLRFRFQNPLFQNSRHVRAVQDCLDFLPPDAIKSIVVFTGEAVFKTGVPHGVFLTISAFMDYLRRENIEVMSLNRMQFCVGRLETARLALSGKTDVEHVLSLKRRHGKVV